LIAPVNAAVAQQVLPDIVIGKPRAHSNAQAPENPGLGTDQFLKLPSTDPLWSLNSISGATTNSMSANKIGTIAANNPAEENTTYNPLNSITALRTNTPIIQTPISVQVIPRAVINDRQATQITEAINTVSGVIATDPDQTGFESYWIRGFYTNTYFLNGVRMNANFTSTYQNTANIDRIEVLKGPASIYNGQTDAGGIVNILTKQPQEKSATSIQQQIGSWSLYRTTLDSTGPLTKDNKSLLYRMVINYENHNNFGLHTNNARDIFIAPTFRWNVDEHTFLNTYLTYSDRVLPLFTSAQPFTKPGPNSQNPFYSAVFGTGAAPASFLPRNQNTAQPWSRGNSRDLISGYQFSSDLNENWNLRQQFQAQLTSLAFPLQNQAGYYDSYGGNLSQEGIYGLPFTQNNFGLSQNSNSTWYYYGGADLTGRFNIGLIENTLLIGTQYNRFNQSGELLLAYPQTSSAYGVTGVAPPTNLIFPVYSQYPPYSFLPTNPNSPGIPNNCNEASAGSPIAFNPNAACSVSFGFTENWLGSYVQDQIKLPQNITIMGGFRYDRAMYYDDVSKSTVSNNQRVTPRFGILWQPVESMSVYGNYLTNFGPAPISSGPGQTLKPVTAEQWEVGVKTELLDKKLSVTFAYYDLIKKNITQASPSDPTGLLQILIPEARNRGPELDVSGEVYKGLKIIAGYTYIASIVTKDSYCQDPVNNPSGPGCVIDNYSTIYNSFNLQPPTVIGFNGIKGNRLGGVPRHSGSLWMTYELQDIIKGLKFGGGVTARSLTPGDNYNDFHLPAYGRFDLMSSYETQVFNKSVNFQINAYNVLDTRYYQLGFPSPYFLQTGSPRSFRGSITILF
jgi:iron complex outermembrane receptor protein